MPLAEEAKAAGAQMQVLNALDTKFQGLSVDQDWLKDDIAAIEKSKGDLVDNIVSGNGVSGTDLYDTVSKYNNLYGANGKVTQAKKAYKDYATEMAYYKKNADKYDANAINFYTKKALADYEKDRSGGFTMNRVAQVYDVQNLANSLTKIVSDNNIASEKTLSEANLVQIIATDGKPTGRYKQLGTEQTFTADEAYSLANVTAIQNSIINNPKAAAYIEQQAAMSGVSTTELVNQYIANGFQINNKKKVSVNESEFNVKNIKPGGAFSGYGSGNNEWAERLGSSTVGSSEQQDVEWNQMVKDKDRLLRNGVDPRSSISYLRHINDIQVALNEDKPADVLKVAKANGLSVDYNKINDPNYVKAVADDTTALLTKKASRASNASIAAKDAINGIKDEFFAKNPTLKEAYTDYNSRWEGVPLKIERAMRDYYDQSQTSSQFGILWNGATPDAYLKEKAKEFGYDVNDKSFDSKYNKLAQTVSNKTRWVYGAHVGESEGINQLTDYFNKNKDRFRSDFDGTETNTFSIKSLDAAQTKELSDNLDDGMKIAFRNPSSATVINSKDILFADSNNENGFTPEQVPWKDVTLEAIDIPNDVSSVTLSLEYAPGGSDKVPRKERITIDPTTRDGKVAMRAIIAKIPDGDLKTALLLNSSTEGQVGAAPGRTTQTSPIDSDYKYNKSADGNVNVYYKNQDVTPSFQANTLGIQELRKPKINKLINQVKMQTKDLPENKRNQVFAKTMYDTLVKTPKNPNGIYTPFDFEILMMAISKANPIDQVKWLSKKDGLLDYISTRYKESAKYKKSYNNFVDVNTYIKPNSYGE